MIGPLKLVSLLLFGVVALAAKPGGTLWGESVTLGSGSARTFAELGTNGQANSLGIEFSFSALNGLPDQETETLLELPAGANLKPFDHVGINWNPHGHDPITIYGLPHFDFHFYVISRAQQLAITCQGIDAAICMKQPPPSDIPANYIPTPAGVPQMGWHWADSRSPEFNSVPFTSTLIYGYYNGEVSFIEPMITRAFLLDQKPFSAAIPQPQHFAQAGNYPTSYSISVDSDHQLYHVVLQNLAPPNAAVLVRPLK